MSGRGVPDTGDDMLGDDMIATRDVGETAARSIEDQGRAAAAPATGSEPTTEAIRDDIEHTRAKMSGTIDEIQERLSPTRLVNEAKETVREATVGKVTGMMNSASDSAQGIVERIKENPMSAAMIGIGAWWLLGKLPGGNSGRSSSSYGRQYGNYGNYTADVEPGRRESFGWSQHGGDAHGIGEMAHDATERMSDYASRGQQRVGEMSDQVEHQFSRWMRDNPLAVGAAAIAVGAAIGLAIPETERENQLIGETRDHIIDRAQDMATQKVQQVASALPGGDDAGKKQGDNPA
jgi:hypothetical protein